jgi:bacteriocin-like protein
MNEQQETKNEELNQNEIPEEELSEVSGGATMVERTAGGQQ